MMSKYLEEALAVEEIAAQIGVFTRQLERYCEKVTGESASRYYRAMRLSAARQLVMYSNESMAEIALAVGYATTRPFALHYKEEYGLRPAEDRRKINMFRVRGHKAIPWPDERHPGPKDRFEAAVIAWPFSIRITASASVP